MLRISSSSGAASGLAKSVNYLRGAATKFYIIHPPMTSGHVFLSQAQATAKMMSNHPPTLGAAAPWIGTVVVGYVWTMVFPSTERRAFDRTQCDDVAMIEQSNNGDESISIQHAKGTKSTWSKVKRAMRLVRRVVQLIIALSPIAALYPLHYLLTLVYPLTDKDDETDKYDAHQVALACLAKSSGTIGWYYRLCLHCVEWSGATAIKMMQ